MGNERDNVGKFTETLEHIEFGFGRDVCSALGTAS